MVNLRNYIPLSVAALSVALLLPVCALAQSTNSTDSSQNAANQSWQGSASQNQTKSALNLPVTEAERQEAQEMVPARAYLRHKLDARDAKRGARFTATLSDNVQLKNGPKLSKGTELIGTIGTDQMENKGTSRLALRITEARMKDGKSVPVEATIVGIYPPESETTEGYSVVPGDEESNDWNAKILKVDEINALSGIDLHSEIDSPNSGVFVSNKKDNVKLSAGSELALAIAENSNAHNNNMGSSGMSQ